MLQSSADNVSQSVKPEERLFPLWKLIGLGIGALMVLGLLYGNQRIVEQIANVKDPDSISVFFLKNMQQEHPQDESWRILLARQQLELGDLSQAQQTVKLLLNGPDLALHKEAALIDLQILEMQMLVGVKNGQKKRDLQVIMVTRIQELLLYATTQHDLSGLADSALLAEDWQLATQVYRQLAQADPGKQGKWFRKGAQLALGQGAYVQAAELFFLARESSQTFEGKRKNYLSALKALIAGNKLQEALVQAEEHLGNLDQDDITLKFLVKLGRAAGNGAFSQKYVEKLLQVSRGVLGRTFATLTSSHSKSSWRRNVVYRQHYLPRALKSGQLGRSRERLWMQQVFDKKNPQRVDTQKTLRAYDPAVYELAYTVYVENGQVEQAYAVASAASAAVPEDVMWRTRWAEVAEWTGRATEALVQWQFLAQHAPSPKVWAAIMRLVPGVSKPAERVLAQTALELVVAQGPASEQQVARWALLEVLHQQALLSNDPAELRELQRYLQTLLPEVQTLAEGEQLLQVSLAHGQWAEAELVLTQLAMIGTDAQAQDWYQQSAEQALGHGAYQQAAAWWFVVQGLAAMREEQRAAFQAGLQALVGGQQLGEVEGAVAQQLGALATDPIAVISAVQALRAVGAGSTASRYLTVLWETEPQSYDPKLSELAYTVYVENGQVEQAYAVARAASAAVPGNWQWRMRWAQGAEWTGRAAEALAQWQALAQHAPSPEAWTAIMRLAPGLTQRVDRGIVQTALELVMANGPPLHLRIARWALLEVLHQQALLSNDPAELRELQRYLQTLLPEVQTLAEGEQLLQVSLAHGQWAEAELVLTQLAKLGTNAQAQDWYQQSAEQALGHGAYQQAAAWWFVVQGQAVTLEEQREAFQSALQALVAGQQVAAVEPAIVANLGALATDRLAVVSAVQALRAVGAGSTASRYLTALWETEPQSYDPKLSELAYTVYVENGQVEQAYAVARAASAAVPVDMTWITRRAQVAEWRGRAAEALAQWQVVAKQQPSSEAWTAVVRLGRGLRNHHASVLGLEELGQFSGFLPNQIKELVDAYEKLGEPEKAIRLLQAELDKETTKELLVHLELIYERMGHVQEASMTLNAIREQFGSTFELAKKRARLLYQRGKLREALAALVEEQDEAPLNDRSYWETVGDVAWDLQEDVVSRHAYETLYQHHEISAFELERFVLLVKEVDPDQAIDLSQQGWKRFSNVGLFLLALDILQGKNEWDKIGQMYDGVTQSQHRLLESYQPYWLVRADFFSRKGNVEAALGSYQEALRRAPHSPSIGLAVLWLLIDSQQRDQLEPWLVKWEESAETDPRFWSAFASAYMLLEKPGMALPYFDRKFQKTPDDYLWILYYADALEAANHRHRARTLRQYAWLTLRKEVRTGNDQAWNRDVMLAYARLALTRETGDGLSGILTRLLHDKSDAIVKELVLSWYLSREEYAPARFWLWRYYGRQLSKPTFAAIALALADNDWVVVDRLLTNNDPPLDRLQQVAAAKHLRRARLVQTLAFEGAEKSPNPGLYAQVFSDSVLSHVASPLDTHQQLPLTAQLWSGVPNVDTRFRFQGRGALLSQQAEHLWSVPLGRGIEIHPFVSRRWQRSTDQQVLRRVPRTDTRIGAHLQWDMGSVSSEFSLYHRKALSSLLALRGRTQVSWGRRFTSEFLIGRNLEADTSVGMLVGGVKDLVRMSHTYQVSKWDTAFLQFDYPQFFTQDRKFLGQGFVVEGAWSHHFRLAYPDVSVRLSGSVQNYSIRDTVSGKLPTLFPARSSTIPVSSVLPESFKQIELGTGVGESTFFSYGTSLRPFAFGGVNLNPETGVGAHLSAGLNGSLFGSDRLSVFGRYLRGGFRQDSTVTEWGLHYQLWF